MEKEARVFEKIIQQKELFTKDELKHALRYMNREQAKFGKDPILLDFKIEEVPTIRKEISIEQILKLK